ncbi:S-adenosyl-L-methionine-dependent methyltransferase [Gongronella butleri]|nr:S-adenosyl-L-methionine-dependent methyltransferase [Gongronella butleri]
MGNRFSSNKKKELPPIKAASVDTSSINSQQKRTATKFLHGRTYHDANSSYWFPNDDKENDRLIAQHFAIKTLWGGNISPSLIDKIPVQNGAFILDVGCASGTWVLDAATEYPASNFVGIDISDTFPSSIKPSNTDFKIGNIQDRLPFPDNTFDFINLRLFILALKVQEWPQCLRELHRVLKPGGILQCIECGMLEGGTEFMRWAGVSFENLITNVGQEPWISLKLPHLLSEIDGFRVIENQRRMIPLNNVTDPLCKDFMYDVIQIFQTAEPYLAKQLAIPPDQFPAFMHQLTQECQKEPPVHWSFVLCAAQKEMPTYE